MEVKELKKLLDAMAEAEVSEMTLETGDYKLSVKRQGQPSPAPAPAPAADPAAAPLHQPAATPVASAASEVAAPAQETSAGAKGHLVEVTAPIVGTFYAGPAPDAPDYVKVGDRVERGQVLCIIEAMKLMNEIEADTPGMVAEILVGNEEPVEYGQVLFRIEPA